MPLDLEKERLQVRRNIGDLEGEWVSDEVIDSRLLNYLDKTSEVRVWLATRDILRYLVAQFAYTSARRREREGGVEVEVYASDIWKALKDRLDDWENNPPDDPEIIGKNSSLFHFGGTKRDEVEDIAHDSNSLGWKDPSHTTVFNLHPEAKNLLTPLRGWRLYEK